MENSVKNRNIFLFIFLGLVTGGIYWIVAFCIMSNEVNKICDGDGKNTMFYLWVWLLGIVTLGIYPLVWFYKTMERLKDNGYRYQIEVKHSGSEFLLWFLLGSFIAVGPIVAYCDLVSNINQFSEFVGVINPCPYTSNPVERLELKKSWNFMGMNDDPNGDIPIDQLYDDPQYLPEGTNLIGDGSVMCLSGDYQGGSFPVKYGQELLIGKDPAICNIVIDLKYKTISRKHVGIEFDPQNQVYKVTDYSSNGTFVANGERLQNQQPTYLKKGTVINLGNSEYSFRLS